MIRTIGVTAVATTTGIETGRKATFASAASDPGFGRRDDPYVVGGVGHRRAHPNARPCRLRPKCGDHWAGAVELSTERGSANEVVDSLDPAKLTRWLVGGRVIRSVRWPACLNGPQGRFGVFVRSDNPPDLTIAWISPVADCATHENACGRGRCLCGLPASAAATAPLRTSDRGERDRAAGIPLTIQIVAKAVAGAGIDRRAFRRERTRRVETTQNAKAVARCPVSTKCRARRARSHRRGVPFPAQGAVWRQCIACNRTRMLWNADV
jgi:hypothetical protein